MSCHHSNSLLIRYPLIRIPIGQKKVSIISEVSLGRKGVLTIEVSRAALEWFHEENFLLSNRVWGSLV